MRNYYCHSIEQLDRLLSVRYSVDASTESAFRNQFCLSFNPDILYTVQERIRREQDRRALLLAEQAAKQVIEQFDRENFARAWSACDDIDSPDIDAERWWFVAILDVPRAMVSPLFILALENPERWRRLEVRARTCADLIGLYFEGRVPDGTLRDAKEFPTPQQEKYLSQIGRRINWETGEQEAIAL